MAIIRRRKAKIVPNTSELIKRVSHVPKKAPGMVGTMISTAGTIAGTIVGKAPVQKSHLVGGRGYRRKHKKITMKDLMDLQMLKHALGVKDLTKGVGGIIITQKLMKKILH